MFRGDECAARPPRCADRRTRQSKLLPNQTFRSPWPPGFGTSLLSTAAIGGATRIAAASRSLRLRERKSKTAAASRSTLRELVADGLPRSIQAQGQGSENLWRRRLNLGIDQNRENLRQPNRRTEFVADAAHDSGLRRKTSKDVRSRRAGGSAHSRIVERQSSLVGEQPQGRRRIRGTSAKSGRGRQSLDQSEATKSQARECAPRANARRAPPDSRRPAQPRWPEDREPRELRSSPGSNPSQSHSPANATRLSSS